jgi:hypothetical protein
MMTVVERSMILAMKLIDLPLVTSLSGSRRT